MHVHRRRMTGALAVVGLLAVAPSASAETVTFFRPDDPSVQPFHRWTVPATVYSVTFDLRGAQSTAGGAQVITTLPLVPGTTYDLYVGGQRFDGSAGYNGGGEPGPGGVGGGGATDVRTGPSLADRILAPPAAGATAPRWARRSAGRAASAASWARPARSARRPPAPAAAPRSPVPERPTGPRPSSVP